MGICAMIPQQVEVPGLAIVCHKNVDVLLDLWNSCCGTHMYMQVKN